MKDLTEFNSSDLNERARKIIEYINSSYPSQDDYIEDPELVSFIGQLCWEGETGIKIATQFDCVKERSIKLPIYMQLKLYTQMGTENFLIFLKSNLAKLTEKQLAKCEEVALNSGDAKTMYFYAVYVDTADKYKIREAILNTGDEKFLARFDKRFPHNYDSRSIVEDIVNQ